jgi:hypothetical protein
MAFALRQVKKTTLMLFQFGRLYHYLSGADIGKTCRWLVGEPDML